MAVGYLKEASVFAWGRCSFCRREFKSSQHQWPQQKKWVGSEMGMPAADMELKLLFDMRSSPVAVAPALL